MYKQSMEDAKKKGYNLRADAISIKAAKASADIASNVSVLTSYIRSVIFHCFIVQPVVSSSEGYAGMLKESLNMFKPHQ